MAAYTRQCSGKRKMIAAVSVSTNITPKKPTATTQMSSSMRRVCSSRSSTSKSSPRFCAAISAVAPIFLARLNRLEGVELDAAMSFAIDQNSNQQTDAERQPDGLIRMFTNDPVRHPGAGNGLFLEFPSRLPGGIQGGGESGPRGPSFLAQFAGSRLEQFLAVFHDLFQVPEQFVRRVLALILRFCVHGFPVLFKYRFSNRFGAASTLPLARFGEYGVF